MSETKAKYIIIDGPDGCGKTTLINKLKQNYPDFIYVKEPGDERFELNTQIRQLFLHSQEAISDVCRIHLMIADRLNLQDYISKQLMLNKTVVSDRSFCSTLAYQSHSQISMHQIIETHRMYLDKFEAHNMILLDIDPDTRLMRMNARNQVLDNIESKGDTFFNNVINQYRIIKQVLTDNGYTNIADKITYLDANRDANSVYDDFVARFL